MFWGRRARADRCPVRVSGSKETACNRLLLCGASDADGRGFSENVGGGEGPPVGSPLFWQNSHAEQHRLFGTHVCPFDGDDGDFGGGDSSGQRAGHLGF